MYDFSKAEKYLDKAEECSIFIDTDANELVEDRIFLNCHEAHITGKNRLDTAKEGWDYVEKLTEDDYKEKLGLLIKVTEACYNVGQSYNVGQKKWFKKTGKLADKVIQYSDVNSMESAEGKHFKGLGLYPANNFLGERLSIFQQSFDIVSQLSFDIVSQFPELVKKNRLLGRIMNSYGSEMTKPGNSDDVKKEGLQLLKRRLKLDKDNNINDSKGQAMTYGAIGRYYHYNTDNIKLAEDNFKEDLHLCKQIPDYDGASIMYSSLAECSLKKEDYKSAIDLYKESYSYANKMKDGLKNILFAHLGLLNAYSFMDEKDHNKKEITKWGDRLTEKISKHQKIEFVSQDTLEKWNKHFKGEWITELEKLVKEAGET
jgi:tetratricopeptide (TPR) repeat protein